MSGAVGSTPSLARSGLPVFKDLASFAFSSSSRIISAVPFLRYASCSSTDLNSAVFMILKKLNGPWHPTLQMHDPPPRYLVSPVEHDLYSFGINSMFFCQDALG